MNFIEKRWALHELSVHCPYSISALTAKMYLPVSSVVHHRLAFALYTRAGFELL